MHDKNLSSHLSSNGRPLTRHAVKQSRSQISHFCTTHARRKIRALEKYKTGNSESELFTMVIMRLRLRNFHLNQNGGYRLSFIWL